MGKRPKREVCSVRRVTNPTKGSTKSVLDDRKVAARSYFKVTLITKIHNGESLAYGLLRRGSEAASST
ncbi:hypothetical protein ACROYT_G032494 [Oculina patagonica]